jgi:hypothetical protein
MYMKVRKRNRTSWYVSTDDMINRDIGWRYRTRGQRNAEPGVKDEVRIPEGVTGT